MGNIIDVDLTAITYIDQTSRIRLNIGDGGIWEFKPISAAAYYDYLAYDTERELDARAELVWKCLVSPTKTIEELRQETIAILNTLFEYLFNYSFLKPISSHSLTDSPTSLS